MAELLGEANKVAPGEFGGPVMTDETTLSASLEDYLEAIFHIVEKKQAARAKDIAVRMKVNSSSVTGALHALSERELVNYAPYDIITLTPKGASRAGEIVRRHRALHDFFTRVLKVEDADAEQAACKMEHVLPPVIFERFLQFLEFVEVCPRAGHDWIEEFASFCYRDGQRDNCERCLTTCVAEIEKRAQQTRQPG